MMPAVRRIELADDDGRSVSHGAGSRMLRRHEINPATHMMKKTPYSTAVSGRSRLM